MNPPSPGVSRVHAHYALGVLTLTYVFNYLDRQLLVVLVEPIKLEFQASDTQMGLLYGAAFALFYVTLSIPAAIWADRGVRRNVLALAAATWSLMTVLCGVAASYWQLLLFRIGVGIGEAGGTPPSQSLIADYYPPKNRSTAMAIFYCGTFIGMLLALVGGGWIAENYSWRLAFLVVGAPGLALALLIRFTLREPAKGQWEKTPIAAIEHQNVFRVFGEMWRNPALRCLLLGSAFAALASSGLNYWQVSFLIRVHGIGIFHAGIIIGAFGATAALLGTLLGGYLCDRLAARDRVWQLRVPVLSLLLSLPLLLLFILWPAGQDLLFGDFRMPVAALFALAAGLVGVWWPAPSYVAVQALTAPAQRTLACAVLLLFTNLLGLGLGPLLSGWVSDLMRPFSGQDSIRWGMAAPLTIYLLGAFFYHRSSLLYNANCWDRRQTVSSASAPAADAAAPTAVSTAGAKLD